MWSLSYYLQLCFCFTTGTRRRRDYYSPSGSCWPAPITPDVSATLPHRTSAPTTQSTLLRRLVAEYRRTKSYTAQHAVCTQDPDDDLSRHSARCADAVAVDHCQLDTTRLRKVYYSLQFNSFRVRAAIAMATWLSVCVSVTWMYCVQTTESTVMRALAYCS